MGQLRELRQQTKNVKITTAGTRVKVVGLCLLVLCVAPAGAALAAHALMHLTHGTAVLAAFLVLLVVALT